MALIQVFPNPTSIYSLLRLLGRYICRAGFYPFLPEVIMAWSLAFVGGGIIVVALLAIYVPTIYIRKTNKLVVLLEKIEANTRK